jgi:type I restriction enzyme, S subunit
MNPTIEYTLEQLGTFEKSYSFSRAIEGDGEYRHIHYGDIHTKLPSVIQQAEILPTISENQNYDTVEYGDILIADASEDYKDLGKAVCFLDPFNTKVISGLHTHRFKPNSLLIKSEYLINLFQTYRYRKFVWKMGTGVSVLGLSKTNLAKYTVTIPGIDEQEKISKYFINLNKKIRLHKEKIDLLKDQKKGYMQKIFSQEIRFKDRNGREYPDWSKQKLGNFSERVTRKNSDLVTKRPLTISAQHGLIDQVEFFNKTVASENLTGYYLLNKGEFAYNKSYSNGYPLGAIKRLDDHENGALSTLYICFKPKDNVISDFLVHYFDSTQWYKEVSLICVEGARNHGLLNVSVSEFFDTLHYLPCIEEQLKIAKFFDNINQKIKLYEQTLKNLQDQKQAFMQQMFI